jgi:hypothetical protein
VIDSAWCCRLLAHGLVRPSVVPPPEIRRLRDLTRLRSTQVEERTRAIRRLEEVLQDAGITLSSVASSTSSASARALLEAPLAGVSDPAELAELAKARLRAKIPRLQEALANRFELARHGVLVAGLLADVDALEQTLATLDARIAAATQPHAELVELLRTIPGRQPRHRAGADRRVRPRHGRLRKRRAPRLLGGDLPLASTPPAADAAPAPPATATAGSNNPKRSATQSQSSPPPDHLTQPTSPTPSSSPPPDPHHRGPVRPTTPPAFTPQEGVDGSSPSEGLAETPANQPFDLSGS